MNNLISIQKIFYYTYGFFLAIFLILIISPFFDTGKYVNKMTLILGFFLLLNDLFFLRKCKFKNFFITILALFTFHTITLRILSLAYFKKSLALDRFNDFSISNSVNYPLLFILLFNLTLYYFLHYLRINSIRIPLKNNFQYIVKKNGFLNLEKRICIFFIFLFFYNFNPSSFFSIVNLHFESLVSIFLQIKVYFIFLISYFYLFRSKVSRLFLLSFILFFIAYIFLSCINGNRGELYFLLTILGFNFLLNFKNSTVKLKYLFLMITFLISGIYIFAIASSYRVYVTNYVILDKNLCGTCLNTFFYISSHVFDHVSNQKILTILESASERLGYLDYFGDIFYHKFLYSRFLNISAYFKSIVDNFLTPGFDLFNAPMIKNITSFIYHKDFFPLKTKVINAYQSDLLTIYGEFYLMFGFFSFFIIPIFVYSLKYLILKVDLFFTSNFLSYIFKVFILLLFFNFLVGFGFDQIVVDAFVTLVSFLFFYFFVVII